MNTQIKKAYVELVALLQANEGKKVATIMPQILELVSSQGGAQSTTRYDEAGKLTHVFCYYHKEWEAVDAIEYGAKVGTKTGLNTMCKQGVSQWTKQQRVAKQEKAKLLDAVSAGEVLPEELPAKMAEIEAARNQIVNYDYDPAE